MAKEALFIPEENLLEVIRVIRAGLKAVKVNKETKTALLDWCEAEESYLKRLEE